MPHRWTIVDSDGLKYQLRRAHDQVGWPCWLPGGQGVTESGIARDVGVGEVQPDAGLATLPDMASDDGWHGLEDDTDDHLRVVTEQLAIWARQTERDVEAYRSVSDELSVAYKMWQKNLAKQMRARNYEWAWRAAFEKTWVAGFRLISSAYQMEKWHAVHRKTRGVEHQENRALRTLRNVLEHLDEAAFVEASYAQRDPNGRKNQSIDKLPKGTLFLGWSDAHQDRLFGLILLSKLEQRASQLTWYDQHREDLEWVPSYENIGYYDDITSD